MRSNQYTADIQCGRQCEVRGDGDDPVPQALEVQGERGTIVGEEQRGTVPRDVGWCPVPSNLSQTW